MKDIINEKLYHRSMNKLLPVKLHIFHNGPLS